MGATIYTMIEANSDFRLTQAAPTDAVRWRGENTIACTCYHCPDECSRVKSVRRAPVSSSCHVDAAVSSRVDVRLLASLGISRCIFLVGDGDHRLLNEKRPETPRAASPRRTNRRERDESKDHPNDHVFRIYCDACYSRA